MTRLDIYLEHVKGMGTQWKTISLESARVLCRHALNNEWFAITGCERIDRHVLIQFILDRYTDRNKIYNAKDTWLFDHDEAEILHKMRTIVKAGCIYNRLARDNSMCFMQYGDYTLIDEGVRFDTPRDFERWRAHGIDFLEMKILAGNFQELYGLGRVLLAMEQGQADLMPFELASHFTILRLIDVGAKK